MISRLIVVFYSFLIRSFFLSQGRNERNISENDGIKNGATSSPEGSQSNVGINIRQYRNGGERWRNPSHNKK